MSSFLKDYMELLDEAESCEYLTPNEEEFISGLQDKYEEYGNGCFISEKQINWLENIVDKG